MTASLRKAYPWVKSPLIASAPMLGAATPALAVSVSRAGGIGFIAGGAKADVLDKDLQQIAALIKDDHSIDQNKHNQLPIGIGFQVWTSDLSVAVAAVQKHSPAIIWLFAPKDDSELGEWASKIRAVSKDQTMIWIQVGTLRDVKSAVELARPDVLVLQGSDAGGHGLVTSASIISLVPEVIDWLTQGKIDIPVLAAGGIVDGRGIACALALGAHGAVMGTRFLAAEEAGVPAGWQRELIRCDDGGVSTVRSTLCDRLKQTVGWPDRYDGRAVLNKGHDDERAGMSDEENVKLYKQETAEGDASWGPHGRMVTYAGTGVGLVRDVRSAEEIVRSATDDTRAVLERAASLGSLL